MGDKVEVNALGIDVVGKHVKDRGREGRGEGGKEEGREGGRP